MILFTLLQLLTYWKTVDAPKLLTRFPCLIDSQKVRLWTNLSHIPEYFLLKLACTEMGDSEIVHPSVIQPTTLDLIDIFVVSVGSESELIETP
jgi:hypothetical protein